MVLHEWYVVSVTLFTKHSKMTSIVSILFIVWLIDIGGSQGQLKTDYLKMDKMNNEIVSTSTIMCYRNISNKYVVVNNYTEDVVKRPDMFRAVDCN